MASGSSGRGTGGGAAGRREFLTLGEAPVERLTDKGVRRLDARAAVVEMNVVERRWDRPRLILTAASVPP